MEEDPKDTKHPDNHEEIEKLPLEKADIHAMSIAAIITFLPVLLLFLGLLYLVIYLIFLR